jgi:hypothetical protein
MPQLVGVTRLDRDWISVMATSLPRMIADQEINTSEALRHSMRSVPCGALQVACTVQPTAVAIPDAPTAQPRLRRHRGTASEACCGDACCIRCCICCAVIAALLWRLRCHSVAASADSWVALAGIAGISLTLPSSCTAGSGPPLSWILDPSSSSCTSATRSRHGSDGATRARALAHCPPSASQRVTRR